MKEKTFNETTKKQAKNCTIPNNFVWDARYSETEDSDKHGRWARICYYKDKMIAWINRIDHIHYGRYYELVDYFPSLQQDNPCLTITMERKKDFETLKKEVEQRFTEFLQDVC